MTTVSKLLSDDMFNETYDKFKDQYDECVQYYIRRQFKRCLETMFEYGLINTERGKLLFIDCCYEISSFDVLGASFNPVLEDSFNVSKWEGYIIQLNTNKIKNTSSMYKNLRCCYRWLQWKKKEKDPMIVEAYSQFVETVLSNFLQDDNNSVNDIYELITFYIYEVKIKLLDEPISIKLYTELCKKYPSLSNRLSERSILGPTYQEYIISKLESRVRPSKTDKTNTNKEINKNGQINKKRHIDIRKPEPLADTIIEKEQDDDITVNSNPTLKNMIYQYKKLVHHYLQVLKNLPYKKFITICLMFILILIHKNRKYIKRISTMTAKKAFKIIVNF